MKKYSAPVLIEHEDVVAITAATDDSARIDENEKSNTLGVGSYDVCYHGVCTPGRGPR